MRQLWQTGYVHNRVRMIVASFLINNCLIHWKQGENGF
ncbi:MAG: FAD-binding domain-containing protein [Francisella endosymbiont of Hyalomma asiaticum]